MNVHINESSMKNILFFAKIANIAEVHIKMETSMEKLINVHTEDGKTINLKAYVEGLLYTNLNDPDMITNPTNFPLNAYPYLSTVKKLRFFTDSEIKGAQKVQKLE